MHERRFREAVAPLSRRVRVVALLRVVVVVCAAVGLVLTLGGLAGLSHGAALGSALAAGATLGAAALVFAWREANLSALAGRIERVVPDADNLVVTAAEIVTRRPRLDPVLADEVLTAAVQRLAPVAPRDVEPLRRHVVLTAGAAISVAALVFWPPGQPGVTRPHAGVAMATPARSADDLRVIVMPPAYTGRDTVEMVNPSAISALEGSRVRIEAAVEPSPIVLIPTDGPPRPFAETGAVAWIEVHAMRPQPLLVRRQGRPAADRLIHLSVEPDRPPAVRIERPGRDLMFTEAAGRVPLRLQASDDLGLAALTLRYTRVSGVGETFQFEEGEWPVAVARHDMRRWDGEAVLRLEALKLQEGDTLVYRAVARDRRPGADPVASESFIIEIGRSAGLASGGFALPEERDRQAISQQMLIIKTERLHAARAGLPEATVLEQARLLAVEQRMVRSEFVFMTGGDVHDEVEEAAHSHELAEGRQENAAHRELLTAIRAMSRAEARLNDGNTAEALVFERAALAALQRAFDRRRYLLRTIPERSRIDLTRRLSGDRGDARPAARPPGRPAADPLRERARQVMLALGDLRTGGGEAALVASHLIALDPSSPSLRRAALGLAEASGTARAAAIDAAQRAVLEALVAATADAPSSEVPRDPLRGRVASALAGRAQ